MIVKDWAHQAKGFNEIEQAWDSGIQSVCYQLSTGGGKTRVIRMVVEKHHSEKKKIYILAHRRGLVTQLSNDIYYEAGIQHGLVMRGAPLLRYRVQVASLGTLIKRLDDLPEPEIIIIDEGHHVKAKSYLKILERWPNAKILIVTATPARTDGSPLSDVCQKMVIGPPMRFLIDNGYLADYDLYAPPPIDLSGVRVRFGEYVEKDLAAKIDKATITGDVIEHYKRIAQGNPTIVSCVHIEHSEHVAEQFREKGFKAVALHSKLKESFIEDNLKAFKAGKIDIICQCDLFGEGIDIPGAVCLIWLRPTLSLIIYLQHIGRVLRGQPGKTAIIIDHVGNYAIHGLPDEERKWTLEGVMKREKGILEFKRCPSCYFASVPKRLRVCPNCFYQWPEPGSRPRSVPQQKPGQLINVKKAKVYEQKYFNETLTN